VVVLDVSPHGPSSLETIKEFHRLREGMPVILTAVTAHVQAVDGHRGVTFLRKPYRIGDLVEQLRTAIPGGVDTGIAEASSS
jgi:DNA-binding NtrC family response regulator